MHTILVELPIHLGNEFVRGKVMPCVRTLNPWETHARM